MIGWLLLATEAAESAEATALMCAFALAAVGLWLLLPKGKFDWRRLGVILSVVAGCIFAWLFQPLGNLLETSIFYVLASITMVSAVSTIVARSPVYSAIWFAVTLLATGGLFILNGAHFLGVATVAVYAGAIVVTFLFVLMLAQPEGHTYYDRISWGGAPAGLATIAGLAFVVATVWAVWSLDASTGEAATAEPSVVEVLQEQHVAALGGILFSKHLITIQVAGTLLFAALVGAVAIAGRDELTGRSVVAASSAKFSPETGQTGSQTDA